MNALDGKNEGAKYFLQYSYQNMKDGENLITYVRI